MIGEVCSRYGWTLDYCLDMPVTSFFCMLQTARKLVLRDKIDFLDIAAAGGADHTWYRLVKKGFTDQLDLLEDVGKKYLNPDPKPPVESNKPFDPEDPMVRNFFHGMFNAKKRGLQ